MVAELKQFNVSGTQFTGNGSPTLALTLLCGVSGNIVIPIRVDATGAIENTT